MDEEQAHKDDLAGIQRELVKWRNEDKRDSSSKPEDTELTDVEKKHMSADQLEAHAKNILKHKL